MALPPFASHPRALIRSRLQRHAPGEQTSTSKNNVEQIHKKITDKYSLHKYTNTRLSGAPGREGLGVLKYNGQLSDGWANVGPRASHWVGLIHARTAKKIHNQTNTQRSKKREHKLLKPMSLTHTFRHGNACGSLKSLLRDFKKVLIL